MMKKMIAVLSALLLCALTAGCAERFTLPDPSAEEAAGDEAGPEDRDETEAAPGTEPEKRQRTSAKARIFFNSPLMVSPIEFTVYLNYFTILICKSKSRSEISRY